MARFPDYRRAWADLDRKKLHLDTAAQISRERKQRVYAQMEVEPGNWVLDVGCGVGVDTIPLAQIVGPAGKVIGIDIDEACIDEAKRRAQEAGVDAWTEHRVADAAHMPFDDDLFDACHSERVFMHLPNRAEVLAEMIRVTKPGGRIALIDPDGATTSVATWEADIERRFNPLWNLLQRNPFAGREAYRLFKEQGVQEVMVDIVALPVFDLDLARYLIKMEDLVDKGLELGIVTQEEIERLNADLEQAAAMDAFYGYQCQITTVGVVR